MIWLRPDGLLAVAKMDSTPDAPERAALVVLERPVIDPASLPELVHGSTVAVNVVLARPRSRSATTRSFLVTTRRLGRVSSMIQP